MRGPPNRTAGRPCRPRPLARTFEADSTTSFYPSFHMTLSLSTVCRLFRGELASQPVALHLRGRAAAHMTGENTGPYVAVAAIVEALACLPGEIGAALSAARRGAAHSDATVRQTARARRFGTAVPRASVPRHVVTIVALLVGKPDAVAAAGMNFNACERYIGAFRKPSCGVVAHPRDARLARARVTFTVAHTMTHRLGLFVDARALIEGREPVQDGAFLPGEEKGISNGAVENRRGRANLCLR